MGATATATKNRFGGFALKSLKSMDGREGEAYSATITLDGRVVGDSRNEGNGGQDFRHFTDRAAGEQFRALALSLYGDGFEVEDRMCGDLVTATMFNRKRCTIFTTKAQGDFWDWDNPPVGEYNTLRGDARPGDRLWLAQNEPGSRIWVKAASDFIAVEDLV